jgi:hypothetical protein
MANSEYLLADHEYSVLILVLDSPNLETSCLMV